MDRIILTVGLVVIWLFFSIIFLSTIGWIPRSVAQPIIDYFILSIILIGAPIGIIQTWRHWS